MITLSVSFINTVKQFDFDVEITDTVAVSSPRLWTTEVDTLIEEYLAKKQAEYAHYGNTEVVVGSIDEAAIRELVE